MSDPELLDAIPHLRLRDGAVVGVGPDLERELGCSADSLLGPLTELGQRLDDVTFEQLAAGDSTLRVRLGPEVLDRPVRLRRIGTDGDDVLIEVRSLADEFRLERLLRRGEYGHMLLDSQIQLQWSMTSNELADVLPGDDPTGWIGLMDPDDMETLGRAIFAVGADPSERRTVRHRLRGDRTYSVIDTIESAIHDPDLRGVLVRSRLADPNEPLGDGDTVGTAPFAGITVSDHLPIGVVVASPDGRILHRNAAAAELAGARTGHRLVPAADAPDEAWLFDGADRDEADEFLRIFTAATDGTPGHCSLESPVDRRRVLRTSVSPAPGGTVVLTIEDTTELAEAERALRASNRLLETIDAHSEDVVIVLDEQGRRRYMSSSADRRLGPTADIGRGSDLLPFVDPADRPLLRDLMQRVRAEPMSSDSVEFRTIGSNGGTGRWHHATMTNLLADPDVQGLLISLRDIHDRHLVERELIFKATHDALTTLPDRSALQSQLEALLRTAETTGERTALVFCDVDNFKLINDGAGHRIGDAVLTEVASRLRASIRSSDFVGRFGGDEFIVVAPDVDDEAHALSLAQRVFDAVIGPAHCDGVDVTIGLSMGVAVTDAECTTAAGLLHRADLAMYESKRRGRGRVSQYAPGLDDDGDGGISLRADLRRAIGEGQLRVHYQSIVPLHDGLPLGYETLGRWEHPTEGMLEAPRFLAVAESAGMMREIGGALVELACDGATRWLGGRNAFVTVNLSTPQLGHADAADAVLEQVRRYGVDPSRLVIELTEAAFAQGPTVKSNLERFRAAGIRIFLDDFGVGYSSLSHLHHFPVDGVKIDASIVSPDVDVDLVRLIVGVAETLGIDTVAEGVETAAQLDAVRRLGVRYAQGYHLGRPLDRPESVGIAGAPA